MKKRQITPIFITLKPNNYLLAFIIGLAFCVGLILFFYIKYMILKAILIFILVFVTFFYAKRDALLQTKDAWRTLQVSALGELQVMNQAGLIFKPKPAASSFISPYLTVLNWQKSPWWRLSLPPLILLGEAEKTRALRVWLKWGKQETETDN